MERAIQKGETARGIVGKLPLSPNLTADRSRSNPLLSGQASARNLPSCLLCDGTGWEPIDVDGVRRLRRCKCAIERRKGALLKRLPERFRNVRLQELTVCDDASRCFAPAEFQEKVINLLRENPDDSYAFFGAPGWGKSHYLAALYRHAVEMQGVGCYYVQASELVRGFRDLELYHETDVCLTDEILRLDAEQGIRPRIFLDEIERLATMSQFTWGKMADFFDLIYRMAGSDSSRVQLCIASNLTRKEFGDPLGAWGTAILRRINEVCVPLDFFESVEKELETVALP